MKPSTYDSIFTLFCMVIVQTPVLEADRERENKRVDLLITWVGITTSSGGWQVQKASAYSKKRLLVIKKKTTHHYVSPHYKPKSIKDFLP